MVPRPKVKLASWSVPLVLVASDGPAAAAEVGAVLDDAEIVAVGTGHSVTPFVEERIPDLVVLDMQTGNMGAMAACLDLRLEESAGRLAHVPVLMLLDRRADVFLARRSAAESWVVKPLDPIRLRRAIASTLAGGTYEDESYRPLTVA